MHERGDQRGRARDERDDAALGAPAVAQDGAGDLVHHARLVEAGAEDHDGDDRDDGITRQTAEEEVRLEQAIDAGQIEQQPEQRQDEQGDDVDAQKLGREQDHGEDDDRHDDGHFRGQCRQRVHGLNTR